MLYLLLHFLLIIELTQSYLKDDIIQVVFNADNQWGTQINNQIQSIFKVKDFDTKYCYVRISLFYNDPSMQLMADYKQLPNNTLVTKYKQGEKIDRISQLENRNTRFLKLKSGMGTIYILTRANNTNNNYQISISKSNEEQCDNDCSKNGICEVYGCSCYKSFIGNDCNQIAEELFAGSLKQLNFNTQLSRKYFYIDLIPMKEQRLRFDLILSQTDNSNIKNCYNCLAVWIFRSKALVKQQLEDYFEIFDQFLIKDGFVSISTDVPQNLTVQSQVLWFAIVKNDIIVDSTQLQMKVQLYDKFVDESVYGEDDNNNESIRLLYIIIPTVVGSIVILLLIYYYLRRRKNQKVNKEIPALKNKSDLYLPNKQKEEQKIADEQEKCGICLIELNTKDMVVVKIKCDHQFHLHCIQEWARKQQIQQQVKQNDCPFCRRPFNLDEIQ